MIKTYIKNNPLFCFAVCFPILSAFANIGLICSDLPGITFWLVSIGVALLSAGEFVFTRYTARQVDFKLLICSLLVGAMVAMTIWSSTTFIMTAQNSGWQKLKAAERIEDLADAQVIAAKALVDNCNPGAYKKCITPNTTDLQARQAELRTAALNKNNLLSEQGKQESLQLIQEFLGVNKQKAMVYRALIPCALFQIFGMILCVLSDQKSLDKRDSLGIIIDNRTEEDVKIYDTWLNFKVQNLINSETNMPLSMKQFTCDIWPGKYGGSYNRIVIDSLARQSVLNLESVK